MSVTVITTDLSTPMLGPVDMTVTQGVTAVQADTRECKYDDAKVRRIVVAVVELTALYGLRTSAVMGQIIHETGAFSYGGQVQPWQNNFAGLGAVTGGGQGASFPDEYTGVQAICSHHLAYIYGDKPNWPAALRSLPASPRHSLVISGPHAGKVRTIGDYTNGRWAYSLGIPVGSLENGYARSIVTYSNRILAYPRGDDSGQGHSMTDIANISWVGADARHMTFGRVDPWPYYLIAHHTDGFDSLNWLTVNAASNVSSHYLLNNNGTVRAQLVRHKDTAHTTGRMNDDSISAEWERYWTDPARRQFASGVPDSVYRNMGLFWAQVVRAEKARGNPWFQGVPKQDQMRDHNDFYSTTCPANLDMGKVYQELLRALESDEKPAPIPPVVNNPNAKQIGDLWIVNGTFDGNTVDMLDYYESLGGIAYVGLPMSGMRQEKDGVYRQAFEGAILEMWPGGFGNITGNVYRLGRYLDHVEDLVK